jgi:basic membrane protein A
MSKKFLLILSVLVIGSILFAACTPTEEPADEPVVEEPEPAVEPKKACLVTDSAGIGDRSFNDAVWMGLEMAESEFGTEITYIESKSADDYAPNLQACIDAEADVVICVGFMMGDACVAAIDANPEVKFLGVDIYGLGKENFIGIDAYMEQSSFLAGYLAAGMTETGVLGTWTGFVGPVVLSFMDGFYTGAMEYNAVHGTEVEVLGYDPTDMDNAANIASWDDTDKGRAISETQMDNGADIIYGVCGNVSTAAAAAMQERGYGYIFGMDQDWTLTNPQYSDQILGSALKNMHVAVHEVMAALETDGSFAGGTDYVLTLANGGTSLELNEAIDVPAELVAEVEALAEKLASGEITGASEEFYSAYRTE